MFRYSPSIRKKITLGYYAIVAIIIGLAIFTFMELKFVETKMMFGEVISEFFDTTLEIRRFEKNYFLYGKESDYIENIKYIAKAQDLLEGNIEGFGTIASYAKVSALRKGLVGYKTLIDSYSSLLKGQKKNNDIQKTLLEEKIRKTGKEIITIAENISKAERKKVQATLNKYRYTLIFLIVFLSVLSIVIGQVVSRMIARPLKLLENSMEMITDGRFEKIQLNSKDREIISLTNAFNKMLKELELRQRHLVQSEKLASLGTLLSGVAHELNNPLSNISSSCQILEEEMRESQGQGASASGGGKGQGERNPPNDFIMELLSQIGEQTDRARNIVRSLLEFSRDKEFKKDTLSLKKIFDETVRFVKGQVPANISININIPDDIFIFADKQRIQQAFLNLIKNAIEAIKDEGEVTIKARKHRGVDKTEKTREIYNYLKYRGKCTIAGDTVDIEISDTGSGIPLDVLPKIFDPFFTTKDVGGGSGLGLFIVHEIIEEHDGCIAADSEAGKGTAFLIRLPLKEK